MAIDFSQLDQGTIEVVSSVDGALDMTEDEYEEYQKSLDPTLIKVKEGQEPTIFVMRKVLPYGVGQRIKNKQMTYDKGEVFVGTGHISDEVRAALVDIKNSTIVFKKAGDGGMMPDLMAMLDAAGITQDLFIARKLYLERASGGAPDKVKKS